MVRRDGAEIRRQRMQNVTSYVLRILQERSVVDLPEVLAEQQYQTGLTREKIVEYLEVIAATGRFELDVEAGKIRRLPIMEATPGQILEVARMAVGFIVLTQPGYPNLSVQE